MKPLTKFKIAIAIVLSVVLGIFISLNMQPIEVSLIVGKIQMRFSMLILSTVLIGMFLGWMLRIVLEHRGKLEQ